MSAITHNLNILSFPDELLLSVMGFVGPKDLCRLSLVNSRFRSLSNDNSIWHLLIQRIKLITNMTLEEIGLKPKQAYLQNIRTHCNLDQGRYQTTTLQHTDCGMCVASFGTKVVSGSNNRTVRVFDLKDPKKTVVLDGHQGWVNAIAIFSDKVVSGSSDNTVRVWDLKDHIVLDGHQDEVNAVAIFGDKVVSGSRDCTVRVWDLKDLKTPIVLQGHQKSVTAVAIFGDKVVSGSNDSTVRVWDLEDPGHPVVLRHENFVTAVAIFGDKIVSASLDRIVRVWNLKNLGNPVVLQGHEKSVTAVAIFGDKVVSGSDDRTVRVWDVSTRKSVTLNANSEICSLAVQGSTICAGLETTIVVYNFL